MGMIRTQNRYTIADRRRVLNLYAAGRSCREIAEVTGVNAKTADYWLRAEGRMRSRAQANQIVARGEAWVTPEAVERLRLMTERGMSRAAMARAFGVSVSAIKNVLGRHGLAAPGWLAGLRRHNSPNTPEGHRRLRRIEAVARMRADGMQLRAIGATLGIHEMTAAECARTPYAAALRVFVHGPADEPRPDHARAMFWRQGLPVDLIARVLGATESAVSGWVATPELKPGDPKPEAPKPSAPTPSPVAAPVESRRANAARPVAMPSVGWPPEWAMEDVIAFTESFPTEPTHA